MWTPFTLSDLWGVDVATVEDLCQRGRLHGSFVNDAWEISTAAVERFMLTRQRTSQRQVPRIKATQTLWLA
jgi:fructosamine-3-kinase